MKSFFYYIFKMNLANLIHLGIILVLLSACNDKAQEGEKPDPIVSWSVTPLHGGATISYTLPSSRNTLYVLAEYERNGKQTVERSSIYKNSITMEGFKTTDPVSVTLYAVSRNEEIKSDPVVVVIEPLESPISMLYNSTHINITFGGIIVRWENITNAEISARLLVKEEDKMVQKDIVFSSLASVTQTFRGFEDVETTFALTFEDQWDNASDTIYFTGTPLYEVEVDKPWSDLRAQIPYDNVTDLPGDYVLSKVWDGSTGNFNRYLNVSGSMGCSFTIDLRQVVKLNRMIMWPYMGVEFGYTPSVGVYQSAHIMRFEMWGTKELDISKLPPATDSVYWLHPLSAVMYGKELPELVPGKSFMVDWVYLGEHAVERLDQLPVINEDDIKALGERGHEFIISQDCEPVRIIRIFPLENSWAAPPLNNYWHIAELSFFGDTKAQE